MSIRKRYEVALRRAFDRLAFGSGAPMNWKWDSWLAYRAGYSAGRRSR